MRIKWLLAGNIIYALGQWLILVIIARFYSSEELGWYFFALSVVAPISLVMSLKLPNLVVTLDDSLIAEKNIVYARHLISICIIVSSYILYFLFFNSNTDFFLINSVLIYKILEQNDDVTIAYFQKDYSFKKIFVLKAIRTLVYVSCVVLSCFYFNFIGHALIVSTMVYTVFWLFKNKNYLVYYNQFSYHANKFYLKEYFKNGIHISLSSSISSLSTNGIRIYIGYSLGASSLALYGLISYNLTAFSIIVSALGQYYLPYFTKSTDNPKKFKSYLLKSQITVAMIGSIIILVCYLFGDMILRLVYGKEYQQYGILLVLIFISSIFKSSSSLIGTAMTAVRIYNFQLKFTFLTLLLTIVLMPFFISRFGMFGAYYGLIIITVVEWLLYLIFFKKILMRRLNAFN